MGQFSVVLRRALSPHSPLEQRSSAQHVRYMYISRRPAESTRIERTPAAILFFVSRITAAKEKTNYLNTTMTGDEARVDVEQL